MKGVSKFLLGYISKVLSKQKKREGRQRRVKN
jgi:hypothetical protein